MADVPELPHFGTDRRPSYRVVRILVLWAAQVLTLALLSALLSDVVFDSWLAAIVTVAVLAILNAVVWPLAVRITAPLIVLTVGLFTFVLNAVFVFLTAAIVPGFEINSFWSALVLAFGLAVVNVTVGSLLAADDDDTWRRVVVGRMVKRVDPPEPTDVPGFLFIQIDGLAADVLEGAIASGYAPTLAKLVESGTHRIVHYECDLSSQTGAMQAGILLGDNSDMPAFRWYEKDTGRVMVSNRPRDAAEIEKRQSSGTGLLVNDGASRANVFSGDADDSLFTFSTAMNKPTKSEKEGFIYVLATPFALFRIIAMTIADIFRELRAARRGKKEGVEPRMHRGGVYPLLRAGTTIILREITVAILLADMQRGVSSAYADFVGYDEVAHHSGLTRPESLDTLRRTDQQIRRLLGVLADAPRPYYVVVLSDHGQTQGATFLQRYGKSLEDVVRELAVEAEVSAPVLAEEGWNNVNGLLTDAAADESRMGRVVRKVTRRRTTEDGEVELGPDTEKDAPSEEDDLVVLASGNLGLISFPKIPGRATHQQIEAAHPGLVEGLRNHEGIGFVLVHDEVEGDLVMGAGGIHHLDDDRVDGDDPLTPFGPNAADHLRRTSGFGNTPDLLINSFYDPVADEGAAFEELIGFHGGMGGRQSHPFVLAPSPLPVPDTPLVGARAIHELFKSWQHQVQPQPS